jgi:hypothetical protein
MGMDNVFPGLKFNPEIHGCKEIAKPLYVICWNQEVILVQHDFTLAQFDAIQKAIGDKPRLASDATKEEIILEYNKILDSIKE